MVLALGLSLLRQVREVLFRAGAQRPPSSSSSTASSARSGSSARPSSSARPATKKVFADNEGEYVDFEEIP